MKSNVRTIWKNSNGDTLRAAKEQGKIIISIIAKRQWWQITAPRESFTLSLKEARRFLEVANVGKYTNFQKLLPDAFKKQFEEVIYDLINS